MEMRLTEWAAPAADLALGDAEVHIWRVNLDQLPARVAQLRTLLTSDEQARADRFHFQKDRDHYIVGRGTLRLLLGRYTRLAPEQLRFQYTSHGKPSLEPAQGGDRLFFNLSHSHTRALYAFVRDRELGVDIERIRPDLAGEQIAERFFSPPEVATLRKLPAHLQAEGFFNCWTRKEAYIKARGEGLSMPLDQFGVTLVPGDAAQLLWANDPGEVTRWVFQALDPGPGYAAAVAVEAPITAISCWDFAG